MDTSSSVNDGWVMAARILIRCFFMSMVLLMVWFAVLVLAGDFVYRFHSGFFGITREQFNIVHYGLLIFLKVQASCLFLFPYLAIWWVRGSRP